VVKTDISLKEAHNIAGELARQTKLYLKLEEVIGIALQAEDDMKNMTAAIEKKKAETDEVNKKADMVIAENEGKIVGLGEEKKKQEVALDKRLREKNEDFERRRLALDHTLVEIEKKVTDSNAERLRVETSNASAIAKVKESYRVDVDKLAKEKKGLEDRVTGLRAELDRLVSKVIGAAA